MLVKKNSGQLQEMEFQNKIIRQFQERQLQTTQLQEITGKEIRVEKLP